MPIKVINELSDGEVQEIHKANLNAFNFSSYTRNSDALSSEQAQKMREFLSGQVTQNDICAYRAERLT